MKKSSYKTKKVPLLLKILECNRSQWLFSTKKGNKFENLPRVSCSRSKRGNSASWIIAADERHAQIFASFLYTALVRFRVCSLFSHFLSDFFVFCICLDVSGVYQEHNFYLMMNLFSALSSHDKLFFKLRCCFEKNLRNVKIKYSRIWWCHRIWNDRISNQWKLID